MQGFVYRNNMKNLYYVLKEVYSPTSYCTPLLLSTDGSTMITNKEKPLKRWAEQFDRVLNRSSTINDKANYRLPQIPIDETLDA